jgi:hypothetical protein
MIITTNVSLSDLFLIPSIFMIAKGHLTCQSYEFCNPDYFRKGMFCVSNNGECASLESGGQGARVL